MNVPDPVDALQLMLALSVNALCANPEITKPPHPLGMLGGQWRLERNHVPALSAARIGYGIIARPRVTNFGKPGHVTPLP